MIHALVLHSPLVGPSTVRALASALAVKGWSTTVPDLRAAVKSPGQFSSQAIERCPSADILIGHSGAGAVLPLVADGIGASATIFIDAVLPGEDPTFTPSGRFLEFVDTIPTVDGRLTPWHEWWPPETMAALVPDEAVRRAIAAETPRLPRSFYDEAITLPELWWTRPAAYLQLSPAYDDERSRAARWDWPTGHLDGGHLDVVVHPDLVAEHVRRLATMIGQAPADE